MWKQRHQIEQKPQQLLLCIHVRIRSHKTHHYQLLEIRVEQSFSFQRLINLGDPLFATLSLFHRTRGKRRTCSHTFLRVICFLIIGSSLSWRLILQLIPYLFLLFYFVPNSTISDFSSVQLFFLFF